MMEYVSTETIVPALYAIYKDDDSIAATGGVRRSATYPEGEMCLVRQVVMVDQFVDDEDGISRIVSPLVLDDVGVFCAARDLPGFLGFSSGPGISSAQFRAMVDWQMAHKEDDQVHDGSNVVKFCRD